MIGSVWLCDVEIGVTSSVVGMSDRHACPATSRAGRTEPALRTTASRDGWVQLADGTHRCPFHAGAAT